MPTFPPTTYHARDLVRCDTCRNAMIAGSSHVTCARCGGTSFHRLGLREDPDFRTPGARGSIRAPAGERVPGARR